MFYPYANVLIFEITSFREFDLLLSNAFTNSKLKKDPAPLDRIFHGNHI